MIFGYSPFGASPFGAESPVSSGGSSAVTGYIAAQQVPNNDSLVGSVIDVGTIAGVTTLDQFANSCLFSSLNYLSGTFNDWQNANTAIFSTNAAIASTFAALSAYQSDSLSAGVLIPGSATLGQSVQNSSLAAAVLISTTFFGNQYKNLDSIIASVSSYAVVTGVVTGTQARNFFSGSSGSVTTCTIADSQNLNSINFISSVLSSMVLSGAQLANYDAIGAATYSSGSILDVQGLNKLTAASSALLSATLVELQGINSSGISAAGVVSAYGSFLQNNNLALSTRVLTKIYYGQISIIDLSAKYGVFDMSKNYGMRVLN